MNILEGDVLELQWKTAKNITRLVTILADSENFYEPFKFFCE